MTAFWTFASFAIAGFLVGWLFNGATVWGWYLLIAVVLLVACGVIDFRAWRAER